MIEILLDANSYLLAVTNLVLGDAMRVPQENDLAVGRAPIPEEVCSPPRAHVPKYPSRPRTYARARPDFHLLRFCS